MEDRQLPKDVAALMSSHKQDTSVAIQRLFREHLFPRGLEGSVIHIPHSWDRILPKSLIIEDDGMPGSGKTTLLERFGQEDHGLPGLIITPEVSEAAKTLSRFPHMSKLIQQFPNATLDDLLFVAENMQNQLPVSNDSEEDRLYREMFKWVSWQEVLRHAEVMEEGKLMPQPIIWQRGIVDSIVFARALLIAGKFDRVPPSSMLDMDAFLMNEKREEELEKARMHAVILHMVKPEITLARKEPSGVVNEGFLEILYRQYLRFYYEYLSRQEETNIGLIIMNLNEGSIEENYDSFRTLLMLLIKYSGISSIGEKFLAAHKGWPGASPYPQWLSDED